MSKKFLTLGILIVVLVGSFAFLIHNASAQAITPGTINSFNKAIASSTGENIPPPVAEGWGIANNIFKVMAQSIGSILVALPSLLLIISGYLFDWIIQFTIIDMTKNIGSASEIGKSITGAWETLRDLANMFFIFVLLWTAFKAMFELNFSGLGKAITNIIIIALLINFSLFFSKVVIDASNIVSVGFYKPIITDSNSTTITGGGGNVVGGGLLSGISGGYMRMLKVQTFFDAKILSSNLDPLKILVMGVMTAIFLSIMAVILLVTALMFVARFILLIFLMILSPLAFVAFIVPAMQGYFGKWKDALVEQSFFAPLFFALTWVVFKLGNAIGEATKAIPGYSNSWTDIVGDPKAAVGLLINYILMIGFAIAALILSKTMASKTPGFTQISGGLGTGVVGGAGVLGRNTIGRVSSLISETQRDKWSKTTTGRAGLWLANKGGSASFDARGIADTKLGKATGASSITSIAGKAGGAGGFNKAIEEKAKEKAKYAKAVYGQTDTEKEKAEDLKDIYEGNKEKGIKGSKEIYEEAVEKEKEKIRVTRKAEADTMKGIKDIAKNDLESKQKIAATATGIDKIEADEKVKEAESKLKKIEEEHQTAIKNMKADIEESEYRDAVSFFKDKARGDEELWRNTTNLGKKRMEEFAGRTKIGAPISTSAGAVVGGMLGSVVPIVGTAIGAGVGGYVGKKIGEKLPPNWRGNEVAARKILEEARGKAKKDAKKLKEDFAKLLGEEEEGGDKDKKPEETKTP